MGESSTLYKATRNWENLQRATFINRAGLYGIPKMLPTKTCEIKNWIGFNFAQSTEKEDRKTTGLHFWLDDYQFQRLWTDPDRYIPLLKSYAAVMSPDFSVYNDFPKAVKIWNVYRNAWLACYWQSHGIKVIPTIMWGSADTQEYCFDGYPENGVVGISTEGSGRTQRTRDRFVRTYNEMLDRLNPTGVILHGAYFEGMGGNIICRVETLTSRIKKRVRGGVESVEGT